MIQKKPAELPRRAASAAPTDAKRRGEAEEITSAVSQNLRRLRTKRNLTLEALATAAGVSRGMLSQIEAGRSVPTIALLWKVARALEVPFAALTNGGGADDAVLIPAQKAKILTSADGAFTSRALFPFDSARRVEFYKLTLAAGTEEIADPHAPGTSENLVVATGQVEIIVDRVSYALQAEDSIVFDADVPHRYVNRGKTTAIFYLVMTYAETVG